MRKHNGTALSMLTALVARADSFRCTPIVDDDFDNQRNQFDSLLHEITGILAAGTVKETTGILKPWVAQLGLRHQGVLLAAIRGCDTAPKNDPSKLLARNIREAILIPHCGDSTKAVSFIERSSDADLSARMVAFAKNLDHYPHHYVMHLVHTAEIIGYKSPNHGAPASGHASQRVLWDSFYKMLCKGLHTNVETEAELDARLNKDERSFGESQQVVIGHSA